MNHDKLVTNFTNDANKAISRVVGGKGKSLQFSTGKSIAYSGIDAICAIVLLSIFRAIS